MGHAGFVIESSFRNRQPARLRRLMTTEARPTLSLQMERRIKESVPVGDKEKRICRE